LNVSAIFVDVPSAAGEDEQAANAESGRAVPVDGSSVVGAILLRHANAAQGSVALQRASRVLS